MRWETSLQPDGRSPACLLAGLAGDEAKILLQCSTSVCLHVSNAVSECVCVRVIKCLGVNMVEKSKALLNHHYKQLGSALSSPFHSVSFMDILTSHTGYKLTLCWEHLLFSINV